MAWLNKKRCANPQCRKSLEGHKLHALTCSPKCRRAVWRAKHKGNIRRNKLKRPETLTIPELDTPNDPHAPRRKKGRGK